MKVYDYYEHIVEVQPVYVDDKYLVTVTTDNEGTVFYTIYDEFLNGWYYNTVIKDDDLDSMIELLTKIRDRDIYSMEQVVELLYNAESVE